MTGFIAGGQSQPMGGQSYNLTKKNDLAGLKTHLETLGYKSRIQIDKISGSGLVRIDLDLDDQNTKENLPIPEQFSFSAGQSEFRQYENSGGGGGSNPNPIATPTPDPNQPTNTNFKASITTNSPNIAPNQEVEVTMKLENTSGSVFSDVVVDLVLPAWFNYVPGSISSSGITFITENNTEKMRVELSLLSPSSPTFTFMAKGATNLPNNLCFNILGINTKMEEGGQAYSAEIGQEYCFGKKEATADAMIEAQFSQNASINENLTLKLNLRNSGGLDLENLTLKLEGKDYMVLNLVNDESVNSQTDIAIETLKINASQNMDLEYLINEKILNEVEMNQKSAEIIQNIRLIDENGTEIAQKDAKMLFVLPKNSINLSLNTSNTSWQLGEEKSFTLGINNLLRDYKNARFTINLPSGTSFVEANGQTELSSTGRNFSWIINELKTGETELAFSLKADTSGQKTFTNINGLASFHDGFNNREEKIDYTPNIFLNVTD